MALDFDLDNIESVEFGVGLGDAGAATFVLVPVDGEVQEALEEMVRDTWSAMNRNADAPELYDPGEKHASVEYLHLPIDDDHAILMRGLHDAVNMPTDAEALTEPTHVFSYFAQLTDNSGRRLTALRRATQFKGVLKSRLIRLRTDALRLIEEDVFRLDRDFDVLIDSDTVHILRPSGFEFAGRLQEAILEAVPANVAAIKADLAFLSTDALEEYAGRHPRAARYLASIRSQNTTNISRKALKALCLDTGVGVTVKGGVMTVEPGHEMGFLEVLDRRRYEVNLIEGFQERFRAGSRSRITN